VTVLLSGKKRSAYSIGLPSVPTGHAMSYEEAASELNVSFPAVKTLIHRLRQQYILLLRQEVGRTVSNEAEIDDEIHYLCEVLVKTNSQV